jgi:energy-coupling factor transporter transmembrane protein EcfT
MLATILFLVIIEKKIKKFYRNLLLSLTCIILFFGNFIVYPERYGNGWDSSLKVLTYFPLEKKMHEYYLANKMNPSETGSEYPMNYDMHDTYLLKESFRFSDLDDRAFNNHEFIVQSNICNTFTPKEIEKLNTKWILVKEFRSWPVYIKIFRNQEYKK